MLIHLATQLQKDEQVNLLSQGTYIFIGEKKYRDEGAKKFAL